MCMYSTYIYLPIYTYDTYLLHLCVCIYDCVYVIYMIYVSSMCLMYILHVRTLHVYIHIHIYDV